MITQGSQANFDKEDLNEVLKLEGATRAGFVRIDTPYVDNLEKPNFSQFLSTLSVDKAEGLIVQIVAGSDFDLLASQAVMATLSEITPEKCSVLMSIKKEENLANKMSLYIIATGLAL